jgi:hypothetical protein
VLNSVRGCICNGEAGGSRQVYRLSAIAQASRDIPDLLRNQAVLVILILVIVLVIGGVIFPAVWSSKKTAPYGCPRRARPPSALEALT